MNQYKKTRGNIFKFIVQKSEKKFSYAFFVCSAVKHWNNLKSSEINVRSLYAFKKNILRYFKREGIW